MRDKPPQSGDTFLKTRKAKDEPEILGFIFKDRISDNVKTLFWCFVFLGPH